MASLWKRTGGVLERWQDWTAVPGLEGGVDETIALRLTCAGTDVRFAVYGIEVAAATDPEPVAGTFALLAGLLQEGTVSVSFDQVTATRP
jgi:hypothetical protein